MTDTITINCTEEIETISNLYDILDNFKTVYYKYKKTSDTEKEVFAKLHELVEEIDKKVVETENEVVSFFANKLNKYWKMELTKYTSMGNSYNEVYIIFPYEMISSNHCLMCVQSDNIMSSENDYSYHGGLKDKGLMIDSFFTGKMTITMTEITKDEFIEIAHTSVNNVINYRLEKMAKNPERYNVKLNI